MRFPISYAHLVRLEGEGGEALHTVRCRKSDGVLRFLFEPTTDLAVIRSELAYVRMALMVRRTLDMPLADEATSTLLREHRAARRDVAEASPGAPPGTSGP